MELPTDRALRFRFNRLEAVGRLYPQSAPDYTTLIRWANLIGAQTVAALNDRAVELARSLKVTRGRKLRTDGTVVERTSTTPPTMPCWLTG